MGDERTYDHTVVIRTVTSIDGITSDWAHIPFDVLQKISVRIVNEVVYVNRVVYGITFKPPVTIEQRFCRAVRISEDEIYGGNAFTHSVSQESTENLENTSISAVPNDNEELQYKRNKNHTFRVSIVIPIGKRFNIKNIFDIFKTLQGNTYSRTSSYIPLVELYLFYDNSV